MKHLFLSLVLLIGLSSCSTQLRPLTKNLYQDFNFSDRKMKQIQFYLSEDIVLFRTSQSGESTIENGSIRMVNGQKIEEIRIRKGTPGVFAFSPEQDKLAISFDQSDELYLVFGPNPRQSNRYVLLAKNWNNGSGNVSYGGEQFKVRANSAIAGLMLDVKNLNNTQINRTVAKGRRIE